MRDYVDYGYYVSLGLSQGLSLMCLSFLISLCVLGSVGEWIMKALCDENLQVVQLQESCSASKKRLSTSLSAHKWLSAAHFHATPLFYQIRRLDGNDSRESTWTWSRLFRVFASESVRVFGSALPDPDAWHQISSSHLLSGRRAGSHNKLLWPQSAPPETHKGA